MVVGVLEGAVETKVRPAVVIASASYLAQRPDVLVGILTTRPPKHAASTDYALQDGFARLEAKQSVRLYSHQTKFLAFLQNTWTIVSQLIKPHF